MRYGCTSRALATILKLPLAWWTVLWTVSGYWRATLGRARDDLRLGLRSFPADDYAIIYRVGEHDVVLILHVVHGSRDIGDALIAPKPH